MGNRAKRLCYKQFWQSEEMIHLYISTSWIYHIIGKNLQNLDTIDDKISSLCVFLFKEHVGYVYGLSHFDGRILSSRQAFVKSIEFIGVRLGSLFSAIVKAYPVTWLHKFIHSIEKILLMMNGDANSLQQSLPKAQNELPLNTLPLLIEQVYPCIPQRSILTRPNATPIHWWWSIL